MTLSENDKATIKIVCHNCNDTGLYDACCRPHRCDCAAGKARYSTSAQSGMYGEYPSLKKVGMFRARY